MGQISGYIRYLIFIHISSRGLLADEQRGDTHSSTVFVSYRVFITVLDNLPGTHANNTHLLILGDQLGQKGGNLSRSSGANWVTKGNRSSLGVDLGRVQVQFAHAVDGLTGECFVKFENVDIALLDAGVLVQVLDAVNRSNSHFIGGASCNLGAGEPCNWLQAMGISPGASGQDCSGCTVGDLRPVLRLSVSCVFLEST